MGALLTQQNQGVTESTPPLTPFNWRQLIFFTALDANAYHYDLPAMEFLMKRLLPLIVLSAVSISAIAADEFTLTIKDHAFAPQELVLPAGKKIKLRVVNNDPTPAEFESKPLSREKIIPGNSMVTINIGPLKPGNYAFVEEYHESEAAAQGTIVVK